jgi:murein DD-endopeptidase MepM/ murein hydrolase activator NlpD
MNAQPPAPVIQYGAEGGAESSGMHIVQGHETVWDIAQRYRVSMPDIILINHLRAPYILADGQHVKLPSPRVYKAKAGDTLYGLSRMFDVTTTELTRLNRLSAPYVVSAGQVLRLPPPHVARPGQPLPPAQTVFSIASANQPTERKAEIAPMVAVLPAPVASMPATARAAPIIGHDDMSGSPASVPGSGIIQSEVLAAPAGSVQVQKLSDLPPHTPVAYVAPQPVAVLPADTPARSGSRFAWPVRGKILSGYGTKANGLHNDGINIAAPRGAPVKAAENGVVVYAGNQLKGFGNLVLVRHADKWMTAYGHMDSLSVAKGQTVKKGERLGGAGSTGGVVGPQLHFEVRRGTEALNPAAYLEKI